MTVQPRALVLSGYGLNCDWETQYALTLAGFQADRVHISQLIHPENGSSGPRLADYHLLALDGGFSWGDDHGAGVILAARLKYSLREALGRFIADGKLIIGICNGFQAMVNIGLLPGFRGNYDQRQVALLANDCGNFRDDWVHLTVDAGSPCIFTQGMESLELPIRHGEGKFYAPEEVLNQLGFNNQLVLRYALPSGERARGQFPYNPNGSLKDVAGICDQTGRIFGLMPHPEAYHHWTHHPRWTLQKEWKKRKGQTLAGEEVDGLKIFKNASAYIQQHF